MVTGTCEHARTNPPTPSHPTNARRRKRQALTSTHGLTEAVSGAPRRKGWGERKECGVDACLCVCVCGGGALASMGIEVLCSRRDLKILGVRERESDTRFRLPLSHTKSDSSSPTSPHEFPHTLCFVVGTLWCSHILFSLFFCLLFFVAFVVPGHLSALCFPPGSPQR